MEEEVKEPKELKTCPDCGQEGIKNMGVHRRYCKVRKETPEPEQAKQPEAQPHQLIISDVQAAEFDADLVAWFVIDKIKGTKISKQMHHIGLVHDERGIIPTALVLASEGSLIPPYLISGFLGLFSEYYQFPEQPEQPREDVPRRELQNELNEPITAPQSEEKQSQVITQPGIHASQPEKKSIFAWPFGKKEKKDKIELGMTNSELATEILRTSKGGTA